LSFEISNLLMTLLPTHSTLNRVSVLKITY
jgi:hypothetical protein